MSDQSDLTQNETLEQVQEENANLWSFIKALGKENEARRRTKDLELRFELEKALEDADEWASVAKAYLHINEELEEKIAKQSDQIASQAGEINRLKARLAAV